MSPILCDACTEIFTRLERPPDEDLFPHHVTQSSFWSAVEGGCMMCVALSKEIVLESNTRLSPADDTRFELKYSFTGELGDANIGHFEVTLYYIEYALQLCEDQPRPKAKSVRKARFWLSPSDESSSSHSTTLQGLSTSSTAAMEQAKAWTDTCKQVHAACNRTASLLDFSPTRLVDLDAYPEDGDHIRVIETTTNPINQPYMTISHRWGKHQFQMFTKANRPRMLDGFSASSLPRAFQEAIHVTRQFGIRYLWIDCLCIIQGSAEDFVKEAGLMHRVYGSSYCNICATAAIDNHEPLFTKRLSGNASQTEVALRWQQPSDRRYTLFDAQLWKHGVFSQPVNQRAWVMQERFLAPCVLHFGAGQLLWECRQLHACEQYPDGLPTAITFGAYDLKTIDLPREADLDMSPQLRVYKLWCVLLYTYTRCGLTQASDKFIALAGIATKVNETLQDTYLAGIWTSWLLYDLCWQVDFTFQDTQAQRLPFYRAPSWSWASLDGPINVGGSVPIHPSARFLCEVVRASAAPISSMNPFGAVQSAELLLCAKLHPFACSPDPLLEASPAEWHRLARAGAVRFQINGVPLPRMGIAATFDDAPTQPPMADLWCFPVRREDHEREDDWYPSDDEPLQTDMAETLEKAALETGPVEEEQLQPTTDPFMWGLVVVAVKPEDPGYSKPESDSVTGDVIDSINNTCFRRVGVFTLGGNDVVDAYEAAIDARQSVFRLV